MRLSPETERGMYDMKSQDADKRQASTGFVLPSNNEWVKAAYYDPNHGGTDSYWEYPTGPFNQPFVSVLNPTTGDVTNATKQPLATYNPNDPNSSVDTPGAPGGAAPNMVSVAGRTELQRPPGRFPARARPAEDLHGQREHHWSSEDPVAVGHLRPGRQRRRAHGHSCAATAGYNFVRDWQKYLGGVANAPAYQVAIYAFGYFPGDPQIGRVYPWMGFRVGVVGNLK